MEPPPTPPEEEERLSCLLELALLDTPKEERFDRYTRVAKHLFLVRAALVSLVDSERQWFKSRDGLEAQETARTVSFCGHAILQPETFVVPDALLDERFSDNPLVLAEPKIRFYAGAPLTVRGQRVGTLCLIDDKPRVFSEQEHRSLRDLADGVQEELDRAKMTDLLDRYETLQRALVEARLKAERASQAKSEFVANVSHELRTPLNAVLGMAQLLTRTSLSDEQRQKLDVILTAGRTLLGLIDSVLDFSKIEAGRMDLNLHEVDLETLFSELEALTRQSVGSRPVEVRFDFSPELPQWIVADDLRVRQVLLNLLSNAAKFTPSGHVHCRASKETHSTHPWLRITVEDTGVGIPKEKHASLFDPFVQADPSTTRRFGGTGLGLAIARRLVALMGGSIDLESAVGTGTTFVVRLPLVAAGSPAQSLVPPTSAASPALRGAKVLLVEDNAFNQLIVRNVLEDAGVELEVAENGKEAVNLLRGAPSRFQLVLMDVQMPVLDGIAATRILREECHVSVPILAMTAGVSVPERDACLSVGMDAFVAKPVDVDALLAQVAAWLSR